MPLYHAQRRSPGKRVMHHGLIDTDNQLRLLRSRDLFTRRVVVAELNTTGPRIAAVEDVTGWTVVQEVADVEGARARLPLAQTRGPYDPVANNCEHFANEVATGKRQSPQVQGWVALGCLLALGFVLFKSD